MTIKPRQPSKGAVIRTPRSDAPPVSSQYPSFSLRYVKPKYCISRCEKKECASFAKKLRTLSTMTWAQIMNAPKHSNGGEYIKELKAKLPQEAPRDSRAIALRFHRNAPMVGFKDGSVFYVVWFDRKMNLYKH